MRDRMLRRLARLAARRPGPILLSALLLSVVCATLATRLELRLGFQDSVSTTSEHYRQLQYVNENYDGMDYLFIVIDAPTKPRAREFAARLQTLLEARPDYVRRVTWRIDLDRFRPFAPLFLEEDRLQRVITDLRDARAPLADWFAANDLPSAWRGLSGIVETSIVEREEIGDEDDFERTIDALEDWVVHTRAAREGNPPSTEDLRQTLEELFVGGVEPDGMLAVDSDGAFFTPDDRFLLMLVKATSADFDYGFNTRMMEAVDRQIANVQAELPGVRVGTTGNISVMRDENLAIRHDMFLTTSIAALGIFLIFLLAFRRPIFIPLVGAPLAMGILWCLGITQLAIGYFSMFTSIFGAILIGLGIDFAIHFVSRYREERASGVEPVAALETMLAVTGRGVITGGLTTTAAFFTLTIARFRGLSQMGFIAGTGILTTLVAMFVVMPALLALAERRGLIPQTAHQDHEGAWAERETRRILRYGWIILVVAILITAGGVYGVLHSTFFYGFRELEPKGMPSLMTMHELEVAIDGSIDYGIVVSDDVEEDRRLVRQLEGRPTISTVDAISNFIPADQAAKADEVLALRGIVQTLPLAGVADTPLANDELGRWNTQLDAFRNTALALKQLTILAGNFALEDQTQRLLERIDALRNAPTQPDIEAMSTYRDNLLAAKALLRADLGRMVQNTRMGLEDVPEEVRENYTGRDGRFIIYAYPRENIWNHEYMQRAVADLQAVQEHALGIAVVFLQMVDEILEDFQVASWAALAAIVLFLLLDFRSIRYGLLALLPLVMGTVWMVGLMYLVGWQFNFINIVIVPLILGIGIDDGVHILHRYKSEPTDRAAITMRHTGKAVLLTSLTTMMGFGAIGFASHRGLSSMGNILFCGIGFCYITSSIVLPILLDRIDKRR